MDINKLCMGCMRELNQAGICPHCGYDAGRAFVEDDSLKPYSILRGKYLVGRVLGKGNFSVTYIGFDLNLQLAVAIKEFHINSYTTKDDFLSEAKTLARCSDLPGIVTVKDFFEENATAYIVMEYVEGMTLREYSEKSGGRLKLNALLPALLPVMQALSGIHKKGLLHRDVNPDNIIVMPDGGMRLLDFGEEKRTPDMLKSCYTPEEQYRADGEQGPWSDIYALSATIYQCITGTMPPDATERIRQDTMKKPSELGVSMTLQAETVLMSGMAVYKEQRIHSMDEFIDTLVYTKTVFSDVESPKMNKEIKKHIPAWGWVAGICLLGIVAIYAAWSRYRENAYQKVPLEEVIEPFYVIDDIGTVDLLVSNHEPGAKRRGMTWDESFFYWLEDIDITSDEDGNIARCNISKDHMCNAANSNTIEYEIYRDPNNGEIYKIVGIEQQGNFLQLTDYYYDNGRVNFIFLRYDSIYTPTYATVTKTGERFYFNDDVLVRWRSINVPGEISEVTLTPRDVSYSQKNYYAQTQEQKSKYDEMERTMLNEAYNVYDAVSSRTGIGVLQGTLQNKEGEPMANRTVNICRTQDDVLLYQGKTQEDGTFSIYVYLDDTECYMDIDGGEDYQNVREQNIFFTDSNLTYSYQKMMLKMEDESYNVQLAFHNAENTQGISENVKITIRKGSASFSGEALLTLQTETAGQINAQLPEGVYTVQAEAAGYMSAYLEIEAIAEADYQIYMVPEIPNGQTAVVLTWEQGDVDLDLTVFTPYQVEYGDMAHIGRYMLSDTYGNRIVTSNASGCEMAYIDTSVLGSYKVYVNDYTNSRIGNYQADAMSKVNARIYIYNSRGMLENFEMPVGESGVVWEAARISGSRIVAEQRVYSEVDGKSWWMSFE